MDRIVLNNPLMIFLNSLINKIAIASEISDYMNDILLKGTT